MDTSITNLQTARKLMTYAENYAKRKENPAAETVSAREMLEQDKVVLQHTSTVSQDNEIKGNFKIQQVDMKLSEFHQVSIHQESRQIQFQGRNINQKETEIETTETISTEIELKISSWEDVEGLVLRDDKNAETDRYQFEFRSGTELIILDKWTLRSTRIWGDPHIDLNDLKGSNNGDFKDLKGSDYLTTFMLQDGTRVTITALDSGIIEEVDIFKGKQHLHGTGSGSSFWQSGSNFFDKEVTNNGYSETPHLNKGDVIYAGGDGNDWFNSSGFLIWGMKTGPGAISKPKFDFSMSIQHKVESNIKTHLIETQA
ncbi:MAG: DUF1521 domain-containing protein [Anaerolineaceae bacterium]|nr:DUF1521 domain-containing protein [Anaerolineaceae bacterium]